jgi:membrane dipeptidase
MPETLASAADLPRLVVAMRQHGFGEELIAKLCVENWLSILERIWK